MLLMMKNKFIASFGLILASTTFHESVAVTYTFPTTDYPEAHSEKAWDGGLVHGLCVLGATEAKASISPFPKKYTYKSLPDFKDGVQVWQSTTKSKWSGVNGNGAQVCEGGIYLMPKHPYKLPSGVNVTVEATAIDDVAGATICAFIMEPFIGSNGHLYDNSGNWGPLLVEQDFTVADVTLFVNHDYKSYCKRFGSSLPSSQSLPSPKEFAKQSLIVSPTSSPTVSPTTPAPTDSVVPDSALVTYTFPTTDYPEGHSQNYWDGGLVHGLCVLGATEAKASISPFPNKFSYESVPDFKDGVQAWLSHGYTWSGVDGNGAQVCEGGIYLMPRNPYRLPSGVNVTVEATAADAAAGATICAFIIEPYIGSDGHQFDNSGNWGPLLVEQDFTVADVTLFVNHDYKSYCKRFGSSLPSSQSLPSPKEFAKQSLIVSSTSSPTVSPTTPAPTDSVVPDSALVTYTFPTTDYPEGHSQNYWDGGLVHGLCVLGATEAKASISPLDTKFSYESVPDFKDGVQAWLSHGYTWSGVDGNGAQVCEGGIYLMPRNPYRLPPGVNVTVEATAIDDVAGATICAFIIEPYIGSNGHLYDNSGNWGPLLVEQDFTVADVTLFVNHDYKSYCKRFGSSLPSSQSLPSPKEFAKQSLIVSSTSSPTVSPTTPAPTDSVVPDSALVTYTFPTTDYPEGHSQKAWDGGLVHGLCVLGATEAKASISPLDTKFSYESVPDFKDGVQAWLSHGYTWSGVDGNGAQVCEGGIYLMPRNPYRLPSGVNVTVEATAVDNMAGATICAFIIEPYIGSDGHQYDNSGNWGPLLVEQDFTVADVTLFVNHDYKSYCKRFGSSLPVKQTLSSSPKIATKLSLGVSSTQNPTVSPSFSPTDSPTSVPTSSPTSQPSDSPTLVPTDSPTSVPTSSPTQSPTEPVTESPSDTPTDSPMTSAPTMLGTGSDLSLHSCQEDVVVVRTNGVTEFPLVDEEDTLIPGIRIVEQDTSSVTVDMFQGWDSTVDKYFFEYAKNVYGSSECYEVDDVAPFNFIERITISCHTLVPTAPLKICLQDTSSNLLNVEDDATLPKCCHSKAPEGTPTVCYELSIRCESKCNTESSVRKLRKGTV